jgi:hypothetical protein
MSTKLVGFQGQGQFGASSARSPPKRFRLRQKDWQNDWAVTFFAPSRRKS